MCLKLKAFRCSECCKAYSRVDRLNEHLRKEDNIRTTQRSGRFECPFSCCEESWRTMAEMPSHCEEEHKENLG